jgi:hypothetical protein
MVCLLIFTPGFSLPSASKEMMSLRTKLSRLHAYDTLILLAAGISCLFAIRCGGQDYAFDSSLIVGLFVESFLLVFFFSISQWVKGDKALIPTGIIKNPVVLWGSIFLFFSHGAMAVVSNFIIPSARMSSTLPISTHMPRKHWPTLVQWQIAFWTCH